MLIFWQLHYVYYKKKNQKKIEEKNLITEIQLHFLKLQSPGIGRDQFLPRTVSYKKAFPKPLWTFCNHKDK